jgi:hypothetical protein
MKTKQCTKCKKEQSIDDFHKQVSRPDGHRGECKECTKIRTKVYYDKNKEEINRKWKIWAIENKDKLNEINKNYRLNNKDKCTLASKKWKDENPDKVKTAKIIYRSNPEKVELELKSHKIWLKNNPDKVRKYSSNRYYKNRDKIDAKINKNISKHMWESLKGNKNGWHWESLVGYTLQNLIDHLENLFQHGMNWNNYGFKGWHIDHIIPISLWKFESYEDREFKQCWSLCNLQPLWAKDNLVKGNKLYENRRK